MDRHLGPTSLVLAALVALIVGSLLLGSGWRWAPIGILAAILVDARRRRHEDATWLAAVGLVIVGTAGLPVSTVWVAAAAAGSVLLARPSLRSRQGWLRRGTLSPAVIAVMVGTVIVAGTSLAVWAGSQPRLGHAAGELSTLDQVIDQAQRIPWWLFPIAALVFAILNSAAEELIYRGIVLQALLPLGTVTAVVLGSLAFGAIHLNGIPSGWWGVAMASVYGGALGWLRIRSDGLAAPVLVHLAADVVIAYIVRYGWG